MKDAPPTKSVVYLWTRLAPARWVDEWEELLLGQGQTNAVISTLPSGKTVRLEVYFASKKEAEKLQQHWGGSVRLLAKKNWAALVPFKDQPILIRDKLIISQSADSTESQEIYAKYPKRKQLVIPAELAFGTGHHATTASCLRMICDIAQQAKKDKRSWQLIDLGSGSGVLSLAARLFGADSAYGIDFDPEATRVAQSNSKKNNIDKVQFETADLLANEPPKPPYDVLVANLFSNLLCQIAEKLPQFIKPSAPAIFSGILFDQLPEVLVALEKAGFSVQKTKKVGRWVALFTLAPSSGKKFQIGFLKLLQD